MQFTIRRAACAAVAAFTITVGAAAEFSIEDWKARVAQESDINSLVRLYIDYLMESNPESGVGFGLHGTEDEPYRYDRRLSDVSAQAWADAYTVHEFLGERLAGIDTDSLSRADQIDHHILSKQIELQLMQVAKLGAMTDPNTYVGLLGFAFTGLVLRDYAPLNERLTSFGERCKAVPGFLSDARANLLPPYVQPTAVQKQVALARTRGMVREGGLFDKTLPELLAQSSLKRKTRRDIEEACGKAVTAVADFGDWFESTIVPRPDGEWRLGAELYNEKYALQMDYPLAPPALLEAAEARLAEVHAELVAVARRIHDDYLGDEIAAGDMAPAAELEDAEVARHVFAKMADDRSTVETLIEDSYALADAIVGFVEEKDLLDLPPTSKLRIEDIPPHLSGFAVAQILTAPPFEPELESVWFWDLSLLSQAEDYLKEYNRPTLALVYIHEGVPGHFVQLEYSNRFERLAPKVFGNGPMIEGWATYIATQIVDEGFTIYPDDPLGHDLQRLADNKLELRSLINAIIDIRLHTSDWPEEEAVELMTGMGFQEAGEATGKLTRAKLSSVQLSSYFAGHHAIGMILGEYQARAGDRFSWKAFNEKLVSAGSPPFFALREHMLGE